MSQSLHIVIFQLGDESFAAETSQIKEIQKVQNISPFPKQPAWAKGVITLRETIVTVVDLAKKLEIELSQTPMRLILVDMKTAEIGFLVTTVSEARSVMANALVPAPTAFLENLPVGSVKGLLHIPERPLLILLDLSRLMSESEMASLLALSSPDHDRA